MSIHSVQQIDLNVKIYTGRKVYARTDMNISELAQRLCFRGIFTGLSQVIWSYVVTPRPALLSDVGTVANKLSMHVGHRNKYEEFRIERILQLLSSLCISYHNQVAKSSFRHIPINCLHPSISTADMARLSILWNCLWKKHIQKHILFFIYFFSPQMWAFMHTYM